MTPEVALPLAAGLGEGPIWDEARQALVFVDIEAPAIHLFDPATGRQTVLPMSEPVSAVACTTRGDWVVAAGRGFHRVDPTSGRTTPIALVEPADGSTRMNDGAVDAAGRFWAGSMSTRGEANRGTLWRLDPDGTVHRVLAGVTTSNGPDWSPDNRLMYYVDTRTRRVDVFDFDAGSGAVTRRRVFLDLAAAAPGRPDGLIVDADGAVWVAFFAGGAVRRYAPDGRLDRAVTFPVSLTTKAAFGGPTLEDLFVTTGRARLTPEEQAAQPLAGALFRVRPGGRGRLPHLFRG